MKEGNLFRRVVKPSDAHPPATVKGMGAVRTEKPDVSNRRAVSTHAPYTISEQSDSHSLEFTPPLIETQATVSQDEYSIGRGPAQENKAWKRLNDATEDQIKKAESVKKNKSNHVADEAEGRVDRKIRWHPAPGEDSTSNHRGNAKIRHRHAIERFYNALHAINAIIEDQEAQATLLSTVASIDRKLDPDEFLKLEKDKSKQDEFQPNQYYRF